jgi:ABC-2 type transport system permease protein
MFLRRIGALAGRIIGQFRRDRRTLALVFIVPLVIMTILNFVLASSESNLKLAIVPPAEPLGTQLVSRIKSAAPDKVTITLFGGPEFTQTDALAPLFIGLFAFFFVFLLTAVAFLRERSQGTLERLMVSPMSRTELVLGYVTGFTLFALIQSIVILLFVIYVLRVHTLGNLPLIFLVTVTLTIAAVNLGIFLSAFARNELQIIQFIPLVLVPQALLGGLFFPVATLPVVLKQAAYVMPLTYANFALKDVMLRGQGLETIWPDLVFLAGFAVAMVILAAISLRRQRA